MEDIVASCAADLQALCPAATTEALEEVAEDLVRRWQEPHRHYHSLRHLAELLAALGEIGRAGELDAWGLMLGRVAGWFHDAVHTGSGPGADEEASAALAVDALDRLGGDVDVIERVTGLVLATADHSGTDDPVTAALLDADLWILSAPEARFDEYCHQVRLEYASVPDADYARGRRQVLSVLRDRPSLYSTAHGRTHWEVRARTNLARELDRLGTVAHDGPA